MPPSTGRKKTGRFSLDASAKVTQERPSSAYESEHDSSTVNEITLRGKFSLKQIRAAKSRGSPRITLKAIQRMLDELFSKHPVPSEYRPTVEDQVHIVKEVMVPQVTITFMKCF